MEEAQQGKYIEQLQEIKRRSSVFRDFSDRSKGSIDEGFLIEAATFQLRRILELIAFNFVLTVGEKAVPAYIGFVKYKNPEKFLDELFEMRSDFYPEPIVQSKDALGNMHWSSPIEGCYLGAPDFITLFEHCERVLEPQRPFALPMSLAECRAANIKWYGKIVSLLNSHLVSANGGVCLFQMGEIGAEPTCSLFSDCSEDISQDFSEESKALTESVSLVDHLRRQIDYLRRSCELYDAGHFDDAIRLAVCIRVLVHDTKASTSLLALMGVKSKLKFITSFGFSQTLGVDFQPVSIIPIFVNSEELGVSVPYDSPSPPILLGVDDWWSEVVWMQGMSLSRKQIVLAAANKDGGAHVDPVAPPSIQELRLGLSNVSSLKINGVEVGTPGHYHFVLLRQFAHELLNSKDLISLVT